MYIYIYVFPPIQTQFFQKQHVYFAQNHKNHRDFLFSSFWPWDFSQSETHRYQGDIVGLPPPGSELHITGNLKVGLTFGWKVAESPVRIHFLTKGHGLKF